MLVSWFLMIEVTGLNNMGPTQRSSRIPKLKLNLHLMVFAGFFFFWFRNCSKQHKHTSLSWSVNWIMRIVIFETHRQLLLPDWLCAITLMLFDCWLRLSLLNLCLVRLMLRDSDTWVSGSDSDAKQGRRKEACFLNLGGASPIVGWYQYLQICWYLRHKPLHIFVLDFPYYD